MTATIASVGDMLFMTCPLVRPYGCVIYSLSSSLLLPSHSLTLCFQVFVLSLCSGSISLSFSPRCEILPSISTMSLFRIYLCVHNLSFASRLYILVVFSVVSVISSCCLDEWTYRSEARDPHRDPPFRSINLFFSMLLIFICKCE